MEPHCQGSLDGLCGFYSIINAVRLVVGNINSTKCCGLLQKCLLAIEEIHKLSSVISYGIGIDGVAHIFKSVIEKEYPIVKRSKPFHKRRNVPIDEFWVRTQEFLSVPNRAAIVLLGTEDVLHWTVVQSISNKRIYLLDSCCYRFVNRRNCTPENLWPTMTYFLERKENENG